MPAVRGSGAAQSNGNSRNTSFQLPPINELPDYFVHLGYQSLDAFKALSIRAKTIVVLIGIAYAAVVLALIRLGPHGILEHLAQFSTFFAQSTFGPFVLLLAITVLSFPPTIGYGTAITLCGLAYGSPTASPGNSLLYAWTIAATGCLVGSLTAFLVCRYALNHHGSQWAWVRKVREGREWKAMEKAVERQGAKMILLIRFCPFPFVYSNLFFASLRPDVVPIGYFLLATLATTPKLFLHVFIGAQTLEAIQAGRGGNGEDGGSAGGGGGWVRLLYVVGASALGALTSWYIYHETKKSLEAYAEEDEEAEHLQSGEEGRLGGGRYRDGDEQTSASRRRLSPTIRGPADQEQESWGWSDDEEQEQSKDNSNDDRFIPRSGARSASGSYRDAGAGDNGSDASTSSPDDSQEYGTTKDAERAQLISRSVSGTSPSTSKVRRD